MKLNFKKYVASFIFILLFFQTSSVNSLDKDIDTKTARVINVSSDYKFVDPDKTGQEKNISSAGLGNKITLQVENLDLLLSETKRPGQSDLDIVLYLDNIAIKGLKPFSMDSRSGTVMYKLKRDEFSKDTWASLMGNWKLDELAHEIPVTIGMENKSIESGAKINLVYIKTNAFLIWIVSFLAILGLFLYLGLKTPILKIKDNDSPYSLSKTQMIIWIFTILTSYLFIWIVMQDFNSINDTAFKLLGLSFITGGAAIAIDTSKVSGVNKNSATSESLQKVIDDLKLKIAELQSSGKQNEQLVSMQKELGEKIMEKAISDDKIKNQSVDYSFQTDNFLRDILQDSDGWSLPRLQVFLWTLILVFIFVKNVFAQLAMPVFDDTLLYLMGISQGAYIGFKLPEKSGSTK